MKENQEYQFRVPSSKSPKEVKISAPGGLLSTSIFLSLNRFCRDSRIRERMLQLDNDGLVEIITTENSKGRVKIVGLSIHNNSEDV